MKKNYVNGIARIALVLAGVCALVLLGCPTGGSGSGDPNQPPGIDTPTTPTTPTTPDPPATVYIAGQYEVAGGKQRACYWTDGDRTDLLPEGATDSYVSSMAVSGADVYTVGRYDGSPAKAWYWKNGTRTTLDDAAANSTISAVTVSGTDVYFAGVSSGLCYWKNGARTSLPPLPFGASNGTVKRIAVSGNDVCILGSYHNGSENIACYWKNQDEKTELGVQDAHTKDIAVSGGVVYVAGHPPSGGPEMACYWQNGIKIDLDDVPPDAANSTATAITASGSDIYIAGWYQKDGNATPCYWKNGIRTDLPAGAQNNADVQAIAVSGADVYAAGWYKSASGDWPFCYWKNGTRTELPIPSGASTTAILDIAVVE